MIGLISIYLVCGIVVAVYVAITTPGYRTTWEWWGPVILEGWDTLARVILLWPICLIGLLMHGKDS